MHVLLVHVLQQAAHVQAADAAGLQLFPLTHCSATFLSPPSLAAPDTDKMIELQLFLDVQEFGRQVKQVRSCFSCVFVCRLFERKSIAQPRSLGARPSRWAVLLFRFLSRFRFLCVDPKLLAPSAVAALFL